MRSRTLRRGWPGFLAVVVALVSQLAQACLAPPLAEPPEAQWAALEAASVLCQTDHAPDGGERPVPHHAADYALCPLGTTLEVTAAILSPEPFVPAPPEGSELVRYERPPGRAPPRKDVVAAYPRGPPRLV